MEDAHKKLLRKKWSPRDINKTIRIMNTAKESKNIMDSLVFWIALLIAIIGNFAISVVLIPFLLALNGVVLYLIVIVLGVSFGFLFEIIIRDIENLERRHHIIVSFIIPAIAVVNIFIITIVANRIELFLRLNNINHNAFVVALVYSVCFMLPYIYYQFYKKKNNR